MPGENSTRRFTTGGIEITERNVGNGPWYPFSIGGLSAGCRPLAVRRQRSSRGGVEHGGHQRKQETAAASTFQVVLVDVPVEIVVDVAPPLDSGPLGCEWCCQREQGLVEVAIDDGLLSGCVNRAGRTGFGSPAELSITIVLLLSLIHI